MPFSTVIIKFFVASFIINRSLDEAFIVLHMDALDTIVRMVRVILSFEKNYPKYR